MKKLALAFILSFSFLLVACTEGSDKTFDLEKNISVYTRDTTSGTRAGFMEGIGFPEAGGSDSVLVTGYVIADNTAILNAMTIDEYGIGYVSLSSVNSNVKGLYFNGVAPTEANVINDTYGLKRPFMWMLRSEGDYPSQAVENIVNAFVAFLGTSDAADIINNQGAVALPSSQTWDAIARSHPVCTLDNTNVTARLGGSDSIHKVAEALSAAFRPKCGNYAAEHDHTGSSDAYRRTQDPAIKDQSVGKDIGFSSRPFRNNELDVDASLRGQLAWDAIVAIVHKDNPISNVTASQLRGIYEGTLLKWADIQG